MSPFIQRLFVVAFVFISVESSAQTFTLPGTVELGGDVSFSSRSQGGGYGAGNSSVTTFSLNPYIGFMVSNGFEMGFMPGIATTSYGTVSAMDLNLFLAAAYNFNTTKNMFPYLEFLLGYNSRTYNSGSLFSGSATQKAGGPGFGMNAGIKFNIAGNGLLLFKMQYLHQEFTQDTYTASYFGSYSIVDATTTSINTVSFGMGFRVFIESKGKKK